MKEDVVQAGWHKFLSLCSKIENPEQLAEFFDLFLTFEERENLAGRYLIVKELLKGEKTQREMAHDLGISIAKITRGSNGLKTVDQKWKQYLLEE